MSFVFTLHAQKVQPLVNPDKPAAAPVLLAMALTTAVGEGDRVFVAERFTTALIGALAFSQKIVGAQTSADFTVEIRRREFEQTIRQTVASPPIACAFVVPALASDWPTDTVTGESYWSIRRNVRQAIDAIVTEADLQTVDGPLIGVPPGAIGEIANP